MGIYTTPSATIKLIALSVCGLIFLVLGCKKTKDNDAIPTGTYNGKFIHDDSGITYNHYTGPANINFNNGVYTASNYSAITPSTGFNTATSTTGNYQLKSDSIVYNLNSYTTGIGIVLTGNYQYHYESDSLIITQDHSPYTYTQFRLRKN